MRMYWLGWIGIALAACNFIPDFELDTEKLGGTLFPGEECKDAEEPWEVCIRGYTCSSLTGVCDRTGAPGTNPLEFACMENAECAYGLVCDHSGVCQEVDMPGTVGAGEACDTDEDCQSFLSCGKASVCEGVQPASWRGTECVRPPFEGQEELKVYFEVPGGGNESAIGEFYRLPFPNDIRWKNGHADLLGHPNPRELASDTDNSGGDNPVDEYIHMMENDLDGFGAQSAVFFRFNYYPKSETLVLNESLFLLNIDPDSEAYGRAQPVAFRARSARGAYICYNWLAIAPGAAAPLLPKTTYAAIMTNHITDRNGNPLRRAPDFETMLSEAPPSDNAVLTAAWQAYAPLRAFLNDQNIEKQVTYDNIAVASVFTTGDPTKRVRDLRKAVRNLPAPELETVARESQDALFTLYQGRIAVPFFQVGQRPFLTAATGGMIEWRWDIPVEQEREPVNFALSVPNDRKPNSGWPVIIYAHGTGGSDHSFIDNQFASRMAMLGVAVLSTEQVQHGERRGLTGAEPADADVSPEALFHNYANPRAARDNNLQAAADLFSAVRFVEGASSDVTLAGILDPNRIYFFGHSQGTEGAFIGAVFEPAVKGMVLSGAGGFLIETFLRKTQPRNYRFVFGAALRDSQLDRYHPMLNIVQADLDVVDPVIYASDIFWVDRSDLGIPRRDVFLSSGANDAYTPEFTHQMLAFAGRLRQSVTSGEPLEIMPVEGGLPHAETYPFVPNITGVMVRYAPRAGCDGHFVMFDDAVAAYQTDEFIRTMIAPNEKATLVPPVFQ